MEDVGERLRKMEKERAGMYFRLSKEDSNNPNTSIENQEKICKSKADSLPCEVVKTYSDVNKTGANIFRPGLQELLKDAKDNKFSILIIKDYSRLSRNNIDQETIVRDFNELGIKIISCDGVKDKKTRQITGLTNEWYIDDCRQKTEQLHQQKLKDNIPLNRPPMGYKIPIETKKKRDGKANPSYDPKVVKRFVPDAVAVKKVIKIFEMKKDGNSIKDICKEFDMGFKTVQRILQNKTYLGYSKYRGVWSNATHKPIVSLELFKSVNGEFENDIN